MNRLTERKENNTILVKCCGENCKYNFEYCEERAENCPTFHEIYKKLAYYEDLEEQGKLEVTRLYNKRRTSRKR